MMATRALLCESTGLMILVKMRNAPLRSIINAGAMPRPEPVLVSYAPYARCAPGTPCVPCPPRTPWAPRTAHRAEPLSQVFEVSPVFKLAQLFEVSPACRLWRRPLASGGGAGGPPLSGWTLQMGGLPR